MFPPSDTFTCSPLPSGGSRGRHNFRALRFPSGRTLARATVGMRVSDIHSLDTWSRFLILPWLTFPAALPKIPYVGFSPVRLQAPGTC